MQIYNPLLPLKLDSVGPTLVAGTNISLIQSGGVITISSTSSGGGSSASGANPSASVGLSAVNGSASTFLRSDGAPALDQTIAPTWTGKHIFAITARTSGVASYLAIQTPADTTLTASTESIGMQFGGNASAATVIRQWATGALTTQRENVFVAPTYAGVAAMTITTAATLAVSGAPVAGTNVAITNPYALWVQAGNSNFAGSVGIGVNPTQLLDVQGAFNSVGQIRAKGINDQGYFAADSDTATKETGYRFYKVGSFKGAWYVPSNSSTVIFTNSAGSDIAFLSTSGFGVGTTSAKLLINTNGLLTQYNNVSTAGWGVPAIYGNGRSTAQTAAVASVATYTVGAADGSFLITSNVNVTTSTAHSFTVTCAYTDETNTSRTLTLSFIQIGGGTPIATITNVTGAGPYEGVPNHIRCKASTAITIATTGTFTTVTYNVESSIIQIT